MPKRVTKKALEIQIARVNDKLGTNLQLDYVADYRGYAITNGGASHMITQHRYDARTCMTFLYAMIETHYILEEQQRTS